MMKVAKCPTEKLALSNCAICNPNDFDLKQIRHIAVRAGNQTPYFFTLRSHLDVTRGTIGFSLPQRKWATLSLNQDIEVVPHTFDEHSKCMTSIVLEVDFLQKKHVTKEPYDSDKMAQEFLFQFPQQSFVVGQHLVFQFKDLKVLSLIVKEISVRSINSYGWEKQVEAYVTNPNVGVTFNKAENSSVNLPNSQTSTVLTGTEAETVEVEDCTDSVTLESVTPAWDFKKLGIGGLDTEFDNLYRITIVPRANPKFFELLGMKPVRGVLLHGPPGTGKTLMARQIGKMLNVRGPKIGKMLNVREPKMVSSPQILVNDMSKSVANIRNLFADAEEENKRMGPQSGLHIFIFDEIDAICKARGPVMNQLLSIIDGVDQLNNVLIIGITNKPDMIDEALRRPNRLDVHVKFSLPDKPGRVEIFNIHTAKLMEHNNLAPDVSIEELAEHSKNFSGRDIEFCVNYARSTAMYRHRQFTGGVDAMDAMVTRADFFQAFQERQV